MADDARRSPTDVEQIATELKVRAKNERAAGAHADDLSDVELSKPDGKAGAITQGFDLGAAGPRVRFRPELGFSSKRVIGRVITAIKRFLLRAPALRL